MAVPPEVTVGSLGIPELFIIFTIFFLNILPLAIGVWLIVTVVKLRTSVKVLEARIEDVLRASRQ
jgi:hypothetical protein